MVVVRNRQGQDLSVNKAWGRLVHRTVSPEATQELQSLFQQAWQEGDTVSHQIVLEGNEADSAPATTSWKVKIFPLRSDAQTEAMCALIDEQQATATSQQSTTKSNQESMILRHFPAAYCEVEVVFDSTGKAVDYLFLDTNPRFKAMTGINNAVGRRVTHVLPV